MSFLIFFSLCLLGGGRDFDRDRGGRGGPPRGRGGPGDRGGRGGRGGPPRGGPRR